MSVAIGKLGPVQAISHLFRGVVLAGSLVAATSAIAVPQAIDYVNPFVGTDGHGHTFPGPTVPFGMVQLSPDTRLDTWDGSSGYHLSDKTILGFSHTHLSGTGVGCMGDIMLMPMIGDGKAASRFSHANEIAKPGYYKVFLDDPKVTVELTSTARAGFHRYTFPQSDRAHVLLDLIHGISNDPKDMYVKVENPTTLSGYRKSGGWGGDRTVYFVVQLSRPADAVRIEQNGTILPSGSTEGKGRIRAYLDFGTKQGEVIQAKVGISATSVEGARKNVTTEIPGWDFAAVRQAAAKQWSQALGNLTVESKDKSLLSTFYTNAYLSYIAPACSTTWTARISAWTRRSTAMRSSRTTRRFPCGTPTVLCTRCSRSPSRTACRI